MHAESNEIRPRCLSRATYARKRCIPWIECPSNTRPHGNGRVTPRPLRSWLVLGATLLLAACGTEKRQPPSPEYADFPLTTTGRGDHGNELDFI